MNAVVGKVPHQFRLHDQAGHNARGFDAFHTQTHPLIENNFFFVDFMQCCKEFGFEIDVSRQVRAGGSHATF